MKRYYYLTLAENQSEYNIKMFKPQEIFEKAKSSKMYLSIMNFAMTRTVPFNGPHGFDVVELTDFSVKTKLPYKRRNLNHVKGLHACALATVTEMTSGLLLMTKLDPEKYRLILRRLEMDYHYQGKMDSFATFEISEEWFQEQVLDPLANHDATLVDCEVCIHDKEGNHLTTGHVIWQLKNWSKTKLKA